jgi:hypothetical protein
LAWRRVLAWVLVAVSVVFGFFAVVDTYLAQDQHRFDCEAHPPPCVVDHSLDWVPWAIAGALWVAALLVLFAAVRVDRSRRRASSTQLGITFDDVKPSGASAFWLAGAVLLMMIDLAIPWFHVVACAGPYCGTGNVTGFMLSALVQPSSLIGALLVAIGMVAAIVALVVWMGRGRVSLIRRLSAMAALFTAGGILTFATVGTLPGWGDGVSKTPMLGLFVAAGAAASSAVGFAATRSIPAVQ